MAKGLTRRLVMRLLRWVWGPIVAFVLVVSVAMACAVWSQLPQAKSLFGAAANSSRDVPAVLNRPIGETAAGWEWTGIGLSYYELTLRELASESNASPPVTGMLSICRTGLPLRCLRWTDDYFLPPDRSSPLVRGIEAPWMGGSHRFARRIPLMPEPVGMALNVVIYSAAIVLPRIAWRRAVVLRRKRKSLCVTCAYPIGDFAICPECGNPTGRDA